MHLVNALKEIVLTGMEPLGMRIVMNTQGYGGRVSLKVMAYTRFRAETCIKERL